MEEQNNNQFEQQNHQQQETTAAPICEKKRRSKLPIILVSLIIVAIAAVLFVFGENVFNSHTHNYSEWNITQESSCNASGKKERFCDCGDKQEVDLPKKSHSYDSSFTVVKNATCKEEGTKEQLCLECSHVITETIPKTNNHTLTKIPATLATCTKTGLSEGEKCTTCGKITIAQTTTPVISHSLKETITKMATSTQAGTKLFNCTNCNYSKIESYTMKILSSEEIYNLAEKCVGEIKTYKKNGTGLSLGTAFVYSSDGKLITNYHVIEGAYSASVTLNGTTYNVSKIIAYDKDIDVAILQINAIGLDTVSIQTENIKGGATVYAVGSSEGYTLSFSTGVIASPSRTFNGVEYIQHEAAISHGNSGGPLYNAYGEVIGINTLTNVDGQNLNFAIACSELNNLTYGTTLTFSQFYKKECDPFTIVMNYVIDNGTYDSEDNEYSVLLKKQPSSNSTYYLYIYYEVSENNLRFSLFTDSSSNHLTSFTVGPSLSGYYEWSYIDSFDYYMTGTINAKTYTDNTLLGYSYNNITYSSLRDSVRKLASANVDLILSMLNIELNSRAGVNAADFGFVSY